MDQARVIQALQTAIRHHRAGQTAAASEIYQNVLAHHPANADALHLLGLIAQQSGQHETAIELIGRALALKPDWVEAKYNLAVAHNALGADLQIKKQTQHAVSAYLQAIRIRPDYPEAHSNLCLALGDIGQLEQAITAGRRSVELNPSNAQAHNNLGIVLKKYGALDEAILAQQKAIAINPKLSAAHFSLGNALVAKGQLDEAIVAFQNAIAHKPNFSAALNNLGNTLMDAGHLDQAIAAYQQAATFSPQNTSFASAYLFSLHFSPGHDPKTVADEHRRWASQHADPLQQKVHDNEVQPHRRLRIGYVSADFRDHPVARFMLPLLEHHNRREFEIVCYSSVVKPDATTAAVKSLTDIWREITSLTPQEATDLIRRDRIDILVDLAAHTSGNRLMIFALKPAPVQVSYLGYPGTTGMSAMDYRFTDAWADPVGMTESLHTETLYRLPNSNWCFTPPAHAPDVVSPPVLANGYVTFGSFNRFAKVTEVMMHTWASILQKTPGSRLVLKTAAFLAASARDRAHRTFAAQGIAPDRITLLGPQPDQATYLATFNRIDIALDSYPYHGTTTTCDTLWMGVPLITLAGESHVSRVGVSLLTNIGLTEWIATTVDHYIELAVALSRDTQRLIALRQSMRQRMLDSPLTDVPAFTDSVETAYRQMWGRWCSGPRR